MSKDAPLVAPLRFVRNLGLVWVCGAVVVGAGWGGMWWGAERRLKSGKAAITALGLPVEAEQLVRQVPEDRNAWAKVEAALTARQRVTGRVWVSRPEWDWVLPYSSEWWASAERGREAYQEVWTRLEEAGLRTEREAPIDWGSIGIWGDDSTPLLRSMCWEAIAEAERRHFVGDDEGCLRLLDGVWAVVDGLKRSGHGMGWSTGEVIEEDLRRSLMRAASGVRVGAGPGELPSERVRDVIARLLRSEQGVWERSMAGDILALRNSVDQMLDGARLTRPYASWIEGVVRRRVADDITHSRGERGDRSVVNAGWPASTWALTWGSGDQPPLEAGFERGAAAVALAVALYRSDHGGHWPECETDLVPKYLPEMPSDTFGRAGDRLEYRLARVAGGRRVVVTQKGELEGAVLVGVPEGRRPVVLGRGDLMGGVPVYEDDEIPAMPGRWKHYRRVVPEIRRERFERAMYEDLGWWASGWRVKPEEKKEE